MKAPRSLTDKLSQWNDGSGISVADWICCVGRYDHFVGFSHVLWPELLEHQGRIYLSDFFSHARLVEMLASGVSPRVAQTFMNALDLSTLFSEAAETIEDDQLLYLAATLEQTWAAKVARDYPGRVVEIIVDNALEEPGIGELLLTLREA